MANQEKECSPRKFRQLSTNTTFAAGMRFPAGRPDGCSSCPVRPSPCIPVDCSLSLSNATYPNFLCRTVKHRALPPKRCEVEQQGYMSSAWHQALAGPVYLGGNTASRPAAQFYSPKYIIIIIITPAQPCKLLFSLSVFIIQY